MEVVILKAKRAIVLSGGGAKGAYQVGVFKAIRKLHYKYDIVTGTSIGALNGVFMVQKEFHKCLWMWKNINFSLIYDDQFPSNVTTFSDKTNIYLTYASHMLKNGGINTSKIEKLVYSVFKSSKFYRSPVDYGIITYNLTDKKPVIIKKEDYKDTKIVDYIIASATCYPAFQKKQIGDNQYIDGGYYDNLPINLAVDLGATEIIAVDLGAPGMKRQAKDKNVKITYIRPRNRIVSFLIFDEEASKQAIQFGYHDTMKTFHQLDGDKYTFYLGDLEQNQNRYAIRFHLNVKNVFNSKQSGLLESLLRISVYHLVFNGTMKEIGIEMKKSLEFLGKVFELDQTKLYHIKDYNKILLKKIKEIGNVNTSGIEEQIKNKNVRKLSHSINMIKYLYDILTQNKKTSNRYLITIATLFPTDFLAVIYLITIEK